MKKKILSFVLALVMVLSFFPGMAMTANAEGGGKIVELTDIATITNNTLTLNFEGGYYLADGGPLDSQITNDVIAEFRGRYLGGVGSSIVDLNDNSITKDDIDTYMGKTVMGCEGNFLTADMEMPINGDTCYVYIVFQFDPNNKKENWDGNDNTVYAVTGIGVVFVSDGKIVTVEQPGGGTTGTTYKWSEIIAEGSEAFAVTLKPGDIIENDGEEGVRFYVGDRHYYDDVWMYEGTTWTVPEAFDTDNDYSIASDSWTWMKKDEKYLILVKTADAKYAEPIEVEVAQNENGKFTVTFEQEENFLYIYVPQMDLYEDGKNADVFVAEELPMYNAMFAFERQTTTSVPAEVAALAVSNGTFEVDSSMMGMLVKLQKDTEFEPKLNTHLQVGVACVGSGRIARDITIADTTNGTVTATVRDSESNDQAKELDIVSLTVTPAEGYKLNSLTVTDAEGNEVPLEDDNFVMPKSAVTVTAAFVELGNGHFHCVCGAAECGSHDDAGEWIGVGDGVDDGEEVVTLDEMLEGGYYYLTENVEITEDLYPDNDRYVGLKAPNNSVLCLNGYVVTFSSEIDTENYNKYIDVNGNFTLTDCKDTAHKFSVNEDGLWVLDETNGTKIVNGGVITGGMNGVYVPSGSNFTMYGGNIVGNDAGGISMNASVATIYGGSIHGNLAGQGGGICAPYSDSTINVYGGVISDNTALYEGGGIYLGGNSISGYAVCRVMGAPVIDNNKANGVENNVQLPAAIMGEAVAYSSNVPVINIAGELTEGAKIGVTAGIGDFFTSGWGIMGDANPADYFFSDDPNYSVAKDEVSGELQLTVKPQATWMFGAYNTDFGTTPEFGDDAEVGTLADAFDEADCYTGNGVDAIYVKLVDNVTTVNTTLETAYGLSSGEGDPIKYMIIDLNGHTLDISTIRNGIEMSGCNLIIKNGSLKITSDGSGDGSFYAGIKSGSQVILKDLVALTIDGKNSSKMFYGIYGDSWNEAGDVVIENVSSVTIEAPSISNSAGIRAAGHVRLNNVEAMDISGSYGIRIDWSVGIAYFTESKGTVKAERYFAVYNDRTSMTIFVKLSEGSYVYGDANGECNGTTVGVKQSTAKVFEIKGAPAKDLGDIIDLGEGIITVEGNTVTVNKPEGDDEYIYFLTVLPEIYLEGTGMTAEQYVERHMLGVDKSIIDATTLDLTDVPGIHELANTTQIFATNLETNESLDGYISGDSVVVVLKLHPDNVKVATYDSAADNPYFGSEGFKTAYAYGIYGVYATRVSAGAGAEVASAELTFTYKETIGAIVAGEELPDLSVLAPEHVVVKDTDGNVLTVVDVDADWLCKAPDLDEGWGWPDSNIAQDGMEYGIRIEVIGDGSYSFGTSWDDLTVLTCQDEKLSVNSAWVGDPNSAFVAFIEMSTVQQPEPPHEHSYTYTPNNNGTHNYTCECGEGEETVENENCTYVNGKCAKCGYVPTYSVTIPVVMENESGEYVPCDDANVTIVDSKGNVTPLAKSGEGVYSADGIADGDYNVVVKVGEGNDQKVKTVLITVNGEDVTLTDAVKISKAKINSKVEVTIEENEDSPIAGALVGGLDNLADDIAAQEKAKLPVGAVVDIDVAMKIDTTMSDSVAADEKDEIKNIAEDQSENLTFLEIKIEKIITVDSVRKEPENIHDVGSLLKIVIPFDTADRSDFAVYRYHTESGNFTETVQKLEALKDGEDPATVEHIEVGDGVITMYVRYFSTYAIGYSEGATPPSVEPEVPVIPEFPVIPEIPVIPANPSYMVSVAGGMDGGKIETFSKSAAQGSTVTITVTPDKGYKLETLSVTDNKGNAVALTSIGGGKYTFVMPAGQVSISATFVKEDTSCSGDYTCPIWQYTDAKATAWYHDGVHYCIENGLMNGLTTTQFAPGGTTTRAQIVTILWRLEGEPYTYNSMSFNDVAQGKWYTEAVRWAAANGIVDGYNATSFGPNDSITREQMVAILWRYCQFRGIDVSVGENTNILSYTDAFSVHSWAMEAMQWACGAGVIGGIADGNSMKLDPTGTATRAQVATMLQRFCTEVMKP